MGLLHQKVGTVGIGDSPEELRGRPRERVELIDTPRERDVTPVEVV